MKNQHIDLENTIKETQVIINLILEKMKNQTNKNMKTTNQNNVHGDEINTK